MSVIGLQRRLYGGVNRIVWRGEDLARLAKFHGYDGPIAPLMTKREEAPLLLGFPDSTSRTAGAESVYSWTVSTSDTDHMFDQIFANGWDLSVHRGNPLVQFAHNSSMLPIGRAVWTGVEGGRLKSKMIFSSDGFAARVRKMVDERTVRAASVGFRPGEWEFAKDPKRPGGINFIRGHVLLEWSVVNIPANAKCLLERVEDAKSVDLTPAPAPQQVATPHLDAMRARLAEIQRRRL